MRVVDFVVPEMKIWMFNIHALSIFHIPILCLPSMTCIDLNSIGAPCDAVTFIGRNNKQEITEGN